MLAVGIRCMCTYGYDVRAVKHLRPSRGILSGVYWSLLFDGFAVVSEANMCAVQSGPRSAVEPMQVLPH